MSDSKKSLSNREKLRQANSTSLFDNKKDDNIINVQLENYNKYVEEEIKNEPIPQTTLIEGPAKENEKNIAEEPSKDLEVLQSPQKDTNKSSGRPKKYNEPMTWIKVQLPNSNYMYIKEKGWKYGGMTGYINHLIEQERDRNK